MHFVKHDFKTVLREYEKQPRLMKWESLFLCKPSNLTHHVLSQFSNMSRTLRRVYSSVPSIPATTIAAQFLSKSQSLPAYTQIQLLDGNQLQRLSATLSRAELANSVPNDGTPLPAGYHLAYFTPSQIEKELGRDGTDRTFNAPHPFTRRMWAGGELEWLGGENNRLKVGQLVTETTKLISAVGKKTRAGEEMVVVGVEKLFSNEYGVALIDRR